MNNAPNASMSAASQASTADASSWKVRPYAGFWIRFAAFCVESIVGMVIGGVIGAVVGVIIRVDALHANPAFYMIVVQIFPLLGVVAYFVSFTHKEGQTFGKMLADIRVTDERGSLPLIPTAFLRVVVGKLVSSAIIGIGFVMCAFDTRKRALHDRIAAILVCRSAALSKGRVALLVILASVGFLIFLFQNAIGFLRGLGSTAR